MFDIHKTMIRLRCSEEAMTMLSRLDTILEHDGQTDRRNSYINIARQRQCADAR